MPRIVEQRPAGQDQPEALCVEKVLFQRKRIDRHADIVRPETDNPIRDVYRS
jgi:hypothetical protein